LGIQIVIYESSCIVSKFERIGAIALGIEKQITKTQSH